MTDRAKGAAGRKLQVQEVWFIGVLMELRCATILKLKRKLGNN